MAWFNFSWKHWQIVLEAEVFVAGNMLSPSLIMIHRHTTYTQFQQLSKNNCLSVHIHIIIAFYCLYIAHCYSIRSFLAFRVWSKPRDHTRSVSNVRIAITCENAHYPHLCKFAENFSDAWWLRRQNFPPNSHNLACWQARIATVRRNSKKLKDANWLGTLTLRINQLSTYYINTSEIPGELSRENMISSQMKRSPLLWLHDQLHDKSHLL